MYIYKLMNFSEEQLIYINYPKYEDTKLIACAGSGKTRSIIGRIKFLIDNGVKKEEIFMITFSKYASDDFKRKIKNICPNYPLKNYSTIDSLAKSILIKYKSSKSENVEILSIAFRNFLKNITQEEIEIFPKNIKHLFIDEAQDLNQTQYEIALLLKEKFNTIIHLVGDPNQNIYQFRNSSNSFLLNFNGTKFILSLNYRSTNEIINFSEDIKPENTIRSLSATNKKGNKVKIITEKSDIIHTYIINYIKKYPKDLSNIAIICPTRGINTKVNSGLSVIFNLLKSNNINVNQLYNESGNYDKHTDKKENYINLITYHGTKGLEFDVVFIMDFYQSLFNKKPSFNDHNRNRYLLYVATSRAISEMFIFTYKNQGYINHWISCVSSNYYEANDLILPLLSYSEERKEMITGITDLISKLTDEQINKIDDMINVEAWSRRIYKIKEIDRKKDEVLFGIFCEELFYLQYNLSRKIEMRKLSIIEMIINSNYITIDNNNHLNLIKKYIIDNDLTWDKYDNIKNKIDTEICRLIEKYFNRKIKLENSIICTTNFIKIIENNIDDIKKSYNNYLCCSDYESILKDFFYLIVVEYAYNINHYYYINDHGKEKQFLIKNKILFKKMNEHIKNNYHLSELEIKKNVNYPNLHIHGEIDFIEKQNDIHIITEIKCVKEISIKHYIQLLLYNFCYNKTFYNQNKLINLLTGMEYILTIKVSPKNMFKILLMLTDIGNIKFDDLNLVYDLETTGLKIDKLEIIEISIKDYDTEMVIYDELIKPNEPISSFITTLTKITNEMLMNKPSINIIKKELNKIMEKINTCKMIAHNGKLFDDRIMKRFNMLNKTEVKFIDSRRLIPLFIKTPNEKLGDIYNFIFKEDFKAHRAMADVDAIIKIMKYLKIIL